jgi:hypothetical protein
MMQPGENERIVYAWNPELTKQRKERLGARVYRVAFETASFQ